MSVYHSRFVRCEWRWLSVIPWYRQVISLIYGLGVITIAVYAIDQGDSRLLLAGTVFMSMLTLLLLFGVELNSLEVSREGVHIDFTDTSSNDE